MGQIRGTAIAVKGASHSALTNISIRFTPDTTNKGIVLANSSNTNLQTIRIARSGGDSTRALCFFAVSSLLSKTLHLIPLQELGIAL